MQIKQFGFAPLTTQTNFLFRFEIQLLLQELSGQTIKKMLKYTGVSRMALLCITIVYTARDAH